jgi:hypothetical protein
LRGGQREEGTQVVKRKLIEVALPLEVINQAAGTEKDRKVGKPQQIHHWWAPTADRSLPRDPVRTTG